MASSGITFAAGDINYIADLNTVVSFSETWATEVENARMGESTLLLKMTYLNNIASEVITARGGQASLFNNINGIKTEVQNARMGESTLLLKMTYLNNIASEVITARGGEASLSARFSLVFTESLGLSQNLIGNSYRATGMADAINPQDLPTLSQVNALISGGGSPGDILITSLNVGTVNDGELVGRVGSSIVGVAKSNIGITDFGIGSATDLQILTINGTSIVGTTKSNISVTDFGKGTATNGDLLVAGASQVTSIPKSSLNVTDLNKGTATNGDLLVAGASQVASIPKSSLNVTDLGYGTLTDGQLVKRVGSSLVGYSLSAIGIYDIQVVASNITAASGKLYLIDTTAAERTITLPASMANGFSFKTVDLKRNFGTTNAHLGRNGHLIEGLAENYDFTVDGEAIEWMYYLTDNNLKRIG